MRDGYDGPLVFLQVAFEPVDRLGIQVVRRLVEQQQVGVLEKGLAERDAPPLAAGELLDGCIARRQAHGIHSNLELAIEVPEVLGVDDVLQLAHLVGQLVEIGVGQRHLIPDRVIAIEDGPLLGDRLLDVLQHRCVGSQPGLLRHEADADAVLGASRPHEIGVLQRHHAQERALARPVAADHADLGARIEGQPDVLEHFLAVVKLRQGLDRENVLLGHRCSARCRWMFPSRLEMISAGGRSG